MADASAVPSSPFLELERPFTSYEAFKLVLLLPLMIVKLIIGVGTLCLIALLNSLAAMGNADDQPLSPARRQVILFTSRYLLPVVHVCIGFRVQVRGREHLQAAHEAGAVTIFNHVSWFDPFVLVWLYAPSGVVKGQFAKLPVISLAIRALQTVYLSDSSNAGTTKTLLARVTDPNYGKPGGYPLLVMAPEGTCGDGKCLLKFRTGSFVLGRPVLPILLQYRHKHHNPAWTNCNELWHFVRLMTQFVNFLDVIIMPVYHPSEAEKADPALYAANVRKRMSDVSGLPLVEQGFEDFRELCKKGVQVAWHGRGLVR